jgi:magnesium-transporting ATPase (P-type)
MEINNLLDDHHSKTGNAGITGDMMETLGKTAGWLRYLGIMGMVVCTLVTLIVFISLFTLSGISDTGRYPQGSVLMMLFLTLLFFIGAGFMSLLVYRYGNNLKKYSTLREYQYFDEAVENNKTLWTVLGFITLISLFLIFLGLLMVGRTTSL